MATFEERSGMGMQTALGSPSAIQKYNQRGWRIYFIPHPITLSIRRSLRSSSDNHVQWVCDRHTWVIPLDQTGVKKRPPLSPASATLTLDPVLCNSWRLTDNDEGRHDGYDCHFYPLRTTLFQYNYAIPDDDLALAIRGWWAAVQSNF